MSESLNRAFIKAYDKEKAGEAKRKANAAELESKRISDLIMRFDTSSVTIPSPHLFAIKPQTESISVSVSSPTAQSTTAQSTIAQSPKPASMPNASEDLRDSIASQMLKAGGWEDQHIDAFIGGFPMISSVHASASRDAQAPRPSREPQPVASTPATPKQAAEPELIHTSPHQPSAKVSELPPLIAPAAPALSEPKAEPLVPNLPLASEPPQRPATAQASRVEVETSTTASFASKIAQRNQEGSIFRLDRPSYTMADQLASEPKEQLANYDDADSSAESEDQSSMLGELSESMSHIDVPSSQHAFRSSTSTGSPAPTAQPPMPKSTEQKTTQQKTLHQKLSPSSTAGKSRQVEEGLRKARMRIFNPVWEVDKFQWPSVCLELLDEMTQNMSHVAQNLISACDEGLQVLAVTSPQSGEGTTTVACCLALLAGTHGLNVAIVDGDIENPTLSYQTNLDVDQDWRLAILNQLPLEEIAVHSIDDQVTLVPLLAPIGRDEMATDDNRIAQMLQELSASFDLVIVDMGTMNSARNLVTTMGEQGIISAAVAVVDYRSSTPQRVEECLRRIRQAGINSVGIVENFAA